MRIIINLEAEADRIHALLEHVLHEYPDAQVHLNPVQATSIKVGTAHPESATPSTHGGGTHHKP